MADDDSEDDFGPAPRRAQPVRAPATAAAGAVATTTASASASALASVYAGSTGPALPIGVTAEDMARLTANRRSDRAQASDAAKADPNVREEWMLTPGEDRPIAGNAIAL
jgi:hypothetical protein